MERRESFECIPDAQLPYNSIEHIYRVLSIPDRFERKRLEVKHSIGRDTYIPEDPLSRRGSCFIRFRRISFLFQCVEE